MRILLALGALALFAAGATPAHAARPNLKVTKLGAERNGAVLLVDETTRNTGRRRAGKSRTSYRLGTAVRLGSRRVGALRRGRRSRAQDLRFALTGIAPGTYDLVACADARRRVGESREKDNCRTVAGAVTVLEPPPPPPPPPSPTPAPPPDADGDGVPDADDNCPAVAGVDQGDPDADGAGNPCDSDDDGDGRADAADCAPLDPAFQGDLEGYCTVTPAQLNQGQVPPGARIRVQSLTVTGLGRAATIAWARLLDAPGGTYAALELVGERGATTVGDIVDIRGTNAGAGNVSVEVYAKTGMVGLAPQAISKATLATRPAAWDNELVTIGEGNVQAVDSEGFTVEEGIAIRRRAYDFPTPTMPRCYFHIHGIAEVDAAPARVQPRSAADLGGFCF